MTTGVYDVIVVGLGGMGSAAAFQLARRGLKVLGLDKFHPPHKFGSSHGRSRAYRQAIFESPAYIPLALRAFEGWRAVEEMSGRSLLSTTGCLIIGRTDSPGIVGILDGARVYDIPVEVLHPGDVAREYPLFVLEEHEVAVYEHHGGVLFPEESVQTFLEQAVRHGAELHTGEAVASWVESKDHVRVRTEKGREFLAAKAVISGGAWNATLFQHPLPLNVTRQVVAWFEPPEPESPALQRMPVFAWGYNPTKVLYGMPGLRGEGPKIAFHYGGHNVTPDDIDRHVHESDLSELKTVAARRMPSLGGRVRQAEVCMYTNTPDLHFIIGPHPEAERVLLLGGFSGHGFKFAPVIGEIAADLVIDGETGYNIDPFSPARFAR